MVTPKPWVTVVVPTFNMGRYLPAAIASLRAQTYENLEIIIQDNCSTDNTAQLLGDLACQGVRVFREADTGQADALNRGFRRGRGEFLSWLNADDLLMPDAVLRAVTALQESPADVVYANCALLNDGAQFLRYAHEIQPFSEDAIRNLYDFIPQPGTFFRRDCFERVGELDTKLHFAMDWDLWCRLAVAGLRIKMVDEVWSGMRLHKQTKSRNGGWRRIREIHRVTQRYRTSIVPLATFAYIYGSFFDLRPRWLDRMLWPWFRFLSGRPIDYQTVLGLRPDGRISAQGAQILTPWYNTVSSVCVEISADRNPGGNMPEVLLDGAPATWHEQGNRGTFLATWTVQRGLRVDALRIGFHQKCSERCACFKLTSVSISE